MWRSALLGVALTATTAAFTPACRQLADIHERASQQTVCSDCVTSSCAADVSACSASSCAPRLECVLGCDPAQASDAACQAACSAESVSDVAGLAAVDSCAVKSCSSACSIECGGVIPLTPPNAAVACAACIAAQCCQLAAACESSLDCVSGLECARGESAPDTVQTCTDVKYAAGSSAYHAFDDCAAGLCADACATGADWGCVGNVALPLASTDTITGTLTVVDVVAETVPVAGLVIVGCGADDITCGTPLSSVSTTDSTGVATLTLPTVNESGRSSFEGYLQITDPANNYLPGLIYVNPAPTQNGDASTVVAVSAAVEQGIANDLSLPFDLTKGALVITAVDCANRPAANMTFEIEDGSLQVRPYYTANAAPSPSAEATDVRGTAIVPETPPGTVSVSVRSVALGRTVATAQVYARAGSVTILRVAPNQ